MANQSVLGQPSAGQHGTSRQGFPMNQTFTFTSGLGMILPVYKQFLNIGEKVTGCPKFFARTEPLLAPAMADVDIYVDVFFVPMRHLISMFDAWLIQVDDAPSDMWYGEDWQSFIPCFGKLDAAGDLNSFGWMTSTIFNKPDWLRFIGSGQGDTFTNYGFGVHRLTNMLGYNAQSLFSAERWPNIADYSANILEPYKYTAWNTQQALFSPYYYQAYQKIYYDFYRDSEYEHNNVKAYNIDDIMNSGIQVFDPSSDIPRLGMFKLRYRNKAKDYFTAVHPSPLFNSIGMLPNAQANLSRIQNWLTAQEPSIMDDGLSVGLDIPGSSSSVGEIIAEDGVVNVPTGSDVGNWLGIINQRAVYGENNILSVVPNNSLYQPGSSSSDANPISHNHVISPAAITEQFYTESVGPAVNSQISLAQIRTAFALDKLLRITNRAGKHVDDQLLAQFGVKIPQGISGEVYRLKSYHTQLHIGEVVQQATTVDSSGADVPLGELAGRGVAVLNDDDRFSFTAPCHGILMACFSMAPRYKYIGAIEKDGMKVWIEDFFRPQSDGLGMQPYLKYEYGTYYQDQSGIVSDAWQYRYLEDKIKFDKTSLAFANVSKNPWSLCYAPAVPFFDESSFGDDQFNFSKVLPWDSNNIFVTQWQGFNPYPAEPTSGTDPMYKSPAEFLSAYLRDPFTIDFKMECHKQSQMSTYGEPELGGI